MKRMTPLSKMSKKRQKAFHAQQRGSWNGLSPVTRVVPNKKAYDRNRARQALRREKLPEECPARFFIAAPLRYGARGKTVLYCRRETEVRRLAAEDHTK